jgi:hypothetical protein
MLKHDFGIGHAGRLLFLGALVALGSWMTVTPAQAGVSCHLINAKGVGNDNGSGGTTGNVIGGGLLQGTISGTITPTGISGTVATFIEILVFNNQHGTLTVRLEGAIDVTTGQFAAGGPVVEATGKLLGATGNISVTGIANFATQIFTEDIGGVVCANLAP